MNRQNQAGFTLVEILVTVVVLFVGLLGVAAMRSVGLQTTQEAEIRTQAMLLAYEIPDCMRANVSAVNDRAYNFVLPGGGPEEADEQEKAPDGDAEEEAEEVQIADSVATSCTAGQMAAYELIQWQADLSADLPGGLGVVAANADEYAIN